MLTVVERASSPNVEKPPEVVRGVAARLPWAWDSLVFAVPMHEASYDGVRDVVTNKRATTVFRHSWNRDNRGNPVSQFQAPGFDAFLEWPDLPVHDSPSTALTVYVRMKYGGSPEADGGAFCNPYDSAASPWVTWSIQAGSGADVDKIYANITLGTTVTTIGPTPSDIPTDQYVSVFLRWRSGEAPTLDVLGERGDVLFSMAHGSTLTGSLGYNTNKGIYLNCNEWTGTNYDALYSQAMVWKRRLTDVEMSCLVADPFGWYSPRRETVLLAGPFPIIFATVYHVYGYAMFATSGERDALRAELQAWLDAHPGDAAGAAFDVEIAGTPVTLAAGMTDTPLMDSLGGGPWDGLTWAYDVPAKEHRDSFGTVPSLAGTYDTGALEGSFFGEATE